MGTFWDKDYESQFQKTAEEIFGKMAGAPELSGLIGPIGFDAIVDDQGHLYVIEVNPRVTGATPIPFLRERLEHIKEIQGQDFEIYSAYLDINVMFGQKFFQNSDLLTQCIQDVCDHFNSSEKVLILPQGITPTIMSKVLFVNDTPDGQVRTKFLERTKQELTDEEQNKREK